MSKLIRLNTVMDRTGLTRSTIYLSMNKGNFPKPIKISERCVAWPMDEIDDWIEARKAEREPA